MSEHAAYLVPGRAAEAEIEALSAKVVAAVETDLIQQALAHTGWNKNRAAQLLRLNRTTLVEKIRKRGIEPPVTNS